MPTSPSAKIDMAKFLITFSSFQSYLRTLLLLPLELTQDALTTRAGGKLARPRLVLRPRPANFQRTTAELVNPQARLPLHSFRDGIGNLVIDLFGRLRRVEHVRPFRQHLAFFLQPE